MMKKFRLSSLMLLLFAFNSTNGIAAEDIMVVVPDQKAALSYQVVDEGKLLVSVLDDAEEPVRGLTGADFRVGSGFQKAEIISAAPLETTEAVALNIVFVVDNSFSMRERRAVKPLLTAMDEFLKTVRPIDNIHLVVFDNQPAMKVEQYALHTSTFNSSDVSKLQSFLRESLEQKSTGKTFLYEAMAAGIEIVRRMPAQDNKFMVVFSDGEDLNSSVSTAFIEEQAKGINNFEAFCVDYMPGARQNRFLASFAASHDGRIWKAKSAAELLPIFQAFTTALRYRYVVIYRMLDPIITEPAALNIDMLTMVDGSPLSNYIFFETGKSDIRTDYVLIKDPMEAELFDPNSLTTAVDRYLNILNLVGKNLARDSTARVKIVGCNSDSGVETANLNLSERRAASVISYLQEIWGIDGSRMDIETRNLPAKAAAMDLVGARPENQRVEIIYESTDLPAALWNDFMVETSGRRALTVKTNLFAEAGLSDWQLTIFGDDQPLNRLTGHGEIKPAFVLPLEELDMSRLTTFRTLGVQAKVTDARGAVFETQKVIVPLTVSMEKWDDTLVRPPQGSLILEPATLTIEELTTIDSSPFLNYIYFEAGDSEISTDYNVFHNQKDIRNFDENELKGTLEKHHNILNILGRRLLEHTDASIRIVGCNSNRGVEQGKIDLSRSRAEAVRAYLKYIWGIEGSRLQVEARNSPAVASTSSRQEGREENQRVEIYSDFPALLDIVKSTYVQEISDAKQFIIKPQISSEYQIDHWTLKLAGDGMTIESLSGSEVIEPAYRLSLADVGLRKLSTYRTITAGIEVTNRKGQSTQAQAQTDVRFIRRQGRLAQKEGYRVLEKYSLILFDFNSSDIKAQNQDIIDRIVARIKEMPAATVSIVGHTDSIGHEAYNLDLSIRRAKSAYDFILRGGVRAGDNISYKGIGLQDALFDNELPEGRALNRTVTVTMEYEQND
jgi:outer membrane protein OmpA-like peptidoglycan-associated protein